MHLTLFVGWTVMTHFMMFDVICRLDRNDTLHDVPQNKKQKAATGLLLDKLHKQDFAGPLASRASSLRTDQPGLLVGFLRILCNGHTDEHDHTCRIGCPHEPDSLTHYNECLRLYNISVSFWRHATILPPRNHFHDLISRVFLQSVQYGIVVLGLLDAFLYAHHKHRLDSANAGNFGDCLTGRVRFMTAITPAHAHAYQTICLTMHFPGVPHHSFRLAKPESRYPYLPDDRSITREQGNDYHGWTIYTDGGTRVVDAETRAGWGVISRSPRGRIFILSGPVITNEAPLAFFWCQNSLQQHR